MKIFSNSRPFSCFFRCIAATATLSSALAAHAFDESPGPSVYAEGGWGEKNVSAAAIGVNLPFLEPRPLWGTQFSAYADLFLSGWHVASEVGDRRRNYVQIGAIATGRFRFDEGRSPWFAEVGIGATLLNHVFHAGDRNFSTAFQFTEVLGVGRNFGARGEHEVSLRLQHVSNGAIKQPNPGQNFARLRYAYRY